LRQSLSETDLTEDLKKINLPTLILHGDDHQIVPIQAAALKSVKIVPNATLKIYRGAPHGLTGRTIRGSTPTCWPSSKAEPQLAAK
jgi:non-heme chloroperoxidase